MEHTKPLRPEETKEKPDQTLSLILLNCRGIGEIIKLEYSFPYFEPRLGSFHKDIPRIQETTTKAYFCSYSINTTVSKVFIFFVNFL
jgi:hypothetical protein